MLQLVLRFRVLGIKVSGFWVSGFRGCQNHGPIVDLDAKAAANILRYPERPFVWQLPMLLEAERGCLSMGYPTTLRFQDSRFLNYLA